MKPIFTVTLRLCDVCNSRYRALSVVKTRRVRARCDMANQTRVSVLSRLFFYENSEPRHFMANAKLPYSDISQIRSLKILIFPCSHIYMNCFQSHMFRHSSRLFLSKVLFHKSPRNTLLDRYIETRLTPKFRYLYSFRHFYIDFHVHMG